jgi:hypothetical protein
VTTRFGAVCLQLGLCAGNATTRQEVKEHLDYFCQMVDFAIGEYTRECLAIRVRRRMTSHDVRYALSELFLEHSVAAHIRSPACGLIVLMKAHAARLADGQQGPVRGQAPAEAYSSIAGPPRRDLMTSQIATPATTTIATMMATHNPRLLLSSSAALGVK